MRAYPPAKPTRGFFLGRGDRFPCWLRRLCEDEIGLGGLVADIGEVSGPRENLLQWPATGTEGEAPFSSVLPHQAGEGGREVERERGR